MITQDNLREKWNQFLGHPNYTEVSVNSTQAIVRIRDHREMQQKRKWTDRCYTDEHFILAKCEYLGPAKDIIKTGFTENELDEMLGE